MSFPASSLPPPTRSWIEHVTGRRVISVAPLPGADTTSVELIRLVAPSGATIHAVLRRYTRPGFLAEEPDRAEHEAAVLRLIAGTDVRAPQLIAVDPDGSECGVPTVLMSRLAGHPGPVNRKRATAAAEELARVHAVDIADLAWKYRPYHAGHETFVPAWAQSAGLWTEALALARDLEPGDAVLLHRDYHAGNLLWSGHTVGGVADWLSACLGPAGVDLGHFRVNLAADGLGDLGSAFVAAYRSASGRAHDPHWDVGAVIDFLPWYEGEEAVNGWPGEDGPTRRSGLEDLLASALA